MNMRKLDIKDIETYYKDRKRTPMNKHTYFSVLVPFVEVEGELYLLFEQRAEGKIMAPGEICFPGGHMEPGESPGRCALRETEEELGIPAGNIKFLGRGETLMGFSSYTLYTTIGQVDYEDFLKISPHTEEVSEGFLVKISEFMDNEPYVYSSVVYADRTDFPYELAGITPDYPWTKGKWETVVYRVKDGLDSQGKERIVWGLTGGIVRHVMGQLEEASHVFR